SGTVFQMMVFALLGLGFSFVSTRAMQTVQKETSTVMLLGEEHAPRLADLIRHAGGIQVIAPAADYSARISAKRLRAAVEFPSDFEKTLGDSSSKIPEVKIYHFEGETRSQVAVGNIRRLLGDYRKQLVEARLAAGG